MAPDRPRRSTIPRSLVGLVVAPPLGAGCYTILFMCLSMFDRSHGADFRLDMATLVQLPLMLGFAGLLGAFFGSFLAYPGMLLFGLPTWLVLRRWQAESGLGYALFGTAGGSVLPEFKTGWSVFGEPYWLHNAVAGALVLGIFWRIARERVSRTAHPERSRAARSRGVSTPRR